jgi:hypothetical protein
MFVGKVKAYRSFKEEENRLKVIDSNVPVFIYLSKKVKFF